MNTSEMTIMALQNLLNHAYDEMMAADKTFRMEQAKERSLMIDWARSQLRETESFLNGVTRAIQAAGYGYASDGTGRLKVVVI